MLEQMAEKINETADKIVESYNSLLNSTQLDEAINSMKKFFENTPAALKEIGDKIDESKWNVETSTTGIPQFAKLGEALEKLGKRICILNKYFSAAQILYLLCTSSYAEEFLSFLSNTFCDKMKELANQIKDKISIQ